MPLYYMSAHPNVYTSNIRRRVKAVQQSPISNLNSSLPRRDQHLPNPLPLQFVNAEVLPSIHAAVHPKPIPHSPILLPTQQSRHEIDLRLWILERSIMQQGALIHKANQLPQCTDVVRQMSLPTGPDNKKRERVDDNEEDKGDVGGHARCGADLIVEGKILRREDASAENGERDGEEADEGYVGYFPVPRHEGVEGDFEGRRGRVIKQEGVFGRCASGLAEVCEGLEGAEIEIYRLPEEEEDHSD